jgi:hypothetical protein
MAITYGTDELTEEQYLSSKATAWNNAAPARAFAALREKRDQLLAETDYAMLTDVIPEDNSAIVNYRKALRDLPASYDNSSVLGTITWPTKPE